MLPVRSVDGVTPAPRIDAEWVDELGQCLGAEAVEADVPGGAAAILRTWNLSIFIAHEVRLSVRAQLGLHVAQAWLRLRTGSGGVSQAAVVSIARRLPEAPDSSILHLVTGFVADDVLPKARCKPRALASRLAELVLGAVAIRGTRRCIRRLGAGANEEDPRVGVVAGVVLETSLVAAVVCEDLVRAGLDRNSRAARYILGCH